MDNAALFFTLIILVLVAMYLYAPLARRYARPLTQEEHDLSALMAERDRVINSLQELDFDFKLGKIPSEDYPTQRTKLLERGADVLRKIDSLTPDGRSNSGRNAPQTTKNSSRRKEKLRKPDSSTVVAPSTGVMPQNVEDQIEEAIATRRADRPMAKREPTDEKIESMISARRMKRKEKSAGFCPRCGKPVLASDRFCPSCGKALT